MKPKIGKEIDLTLGAGHNHPSIVADDPTKQYLAKIGGGWFLGVFSTEWYGLCFLGWYGGHLQYDKPGTNGSKWEQLFEISLP